MRTLVAALCLAIGTPAFGGGGESFAYRGNLKVDVPPAAVALDQRGLRLLSDGRYKEAVDVLTQSLALAPGNPRALANRAGAYLATGRVDEAVRDYERAAALSPEAKAALAPLLSRAYLTRGMRHLDKKDRRAALDDFKEAVSIDEQNAKAYSELAFLAQTRGDHDDCLDYAAKALAADPKLADAHANRGACLAGKGQDAEALQELNTAIAREGRGEYFVSRATLHLRAKNCALAVADARRAAALNPRLKPLVEPILRECKK
jgi:Tfp pilus assembly protein PilF